MRWTLSSKIILSISSALAALSVVVTALTFVEARRNALEAQGELADVLNYTTEILLSQEAPASIQRVTENIATLRHVREIAIVDRDKKVVASSDRLRVGRALESAILDEFLSGGSFERTVREKGDTVVIVQPLRGSRFMGGTAGDIVGAAQLTLSRDVIYENARTSALRLLGISLGSYVVLSVVLSLVLRRLVTGPIQALAAAAQRFREGDRSLRSRIRRSDEVGLLSTTFDEMADEVDAMLSSLEDKVASRTKALEAQRTALESALEELTSSTAARIALAEAVRQLSTPVIKLYDRVILMPLVGTIDADRGRQIERSLLDGIQAHEAEFILLDLTGVAIVDGEVAGHLMRAARSVRLLGASMIVVGITARVAQSIIDLGVDLTGLTTQTDLKSGLVHVLRGVGGSASRAVARPVPAAT